jgi:ABC-type multidrug transport system fused ATPase/permease subunit
LVYARVRPAARDTRRLGAAAHSPVYSHYADALAGRETIAAFNAATAWRSANASRVSRMSRAAVGNEAVQKWAQALTTQAGCGLYACAAAGCVLLHHAGRLPMSFVGLVLLQASGLQRAAMDLMMRATRIETEFVSVERLAEYVRIEGEEGEGEVGGKNGSFAGEARQRRGGRVGGVGGSPLGGWQGVDSPSRPTFPAAHPPGRIEVREVILRYAPQLPPVLRGTRLTIPGGTKLALCGRTGCGKSSLLGALVRLYPIDGGSMILDGVDLCRAPLAEVRKAVRVVAQEPLLLQGSLRLNLLAFSDKMGGAGQAGGRRAVAGEAGGERHGEGPACLGHGAEARAEAVAWAEAEVWAALELVGLRGRIAALPLGLETPAAGAGLSEGERQLLSLARGLVGVSSQGSGGADIEAEPGGARPAGAFNPARPLVRALLCDEPTASVDGSADAAAHAALLGLRCTVVVAAHRLGQTRRFDRVAVMAAGRVVEEGTPEALLRDAGGRYARLCARAGEDGAGGGARRGPPERVCSAPRVFGEQI